MTNDEDLSAIRRVLLAAGTGSIADDSVKAARAIAAVLQAELTALFVEDPNLVRMAALPFTREIGAASGSVHSIEPADIERALRLQAERMRRSLAELASFRVERGGFAQRILEEISDSVAAVLSPQWQIMLPASRVSVQPEARHVVTLYDDNPGSVRALALGLRLSQSQADLCVAVAGTDAEFSARQEAARSRVAAAAGPMEFIRLATDQPLDLARAVRRRGGAALVLSSRSMKMTTERLRVLLENLQCPLVLLR
jgi:hypothetical protein